MDLSNWQMMFSNREVVKWITWWLVNGKNHNLLFIPQLFKTDTTQLFRDKFNPGLFPALTTPRWQCVPTCRSVWCRSPCGRCSWSSTRPWSRPRSRLRAQGRPPHPHPESNLQSCEKSFRAWKKKYQQDLNIFLANNFQQKLLVLS